MPQKKISIYKASRIFELYALNRLNRSQIAKSLNLSHDTVNKYVEYYMQSDLTYMDLLQHSDKALVDMVYPKQIFPIRQDV